MLNSPTIGKFRLEVRCIQSLLLSLIFHLCILKWCTVSILPFYVVTKLQGLLIHCSKHFHQKDLATGC